MSSKKNDSHHNYDKYVKETAKHAGYLSIVLFVVFGIMVNLLPTLWGSKIETKTLTLLLAFSGIIAAFICIVTIVVITVVLKNNEPFEEERRQSCLEEELKCRDCMADLLDVQKHLYGKEIEEALTELSVDDVNKISQLIKSLIKDDGKITDDEKTKIQNFCEILVKAKRAGRFASYISFNDMTIIEGNVDNNATIIIVSSSVSCDDQLRPIIINNLLRGVKYKYFFPGNGYEETFRALLDQFNNNLAEWQKNDQITNEIIKNQISCAIFPVEYMQMSFTAYNFHRAGSAISPEIIVKFPALDSATINEYPLFYFINKENVINRKMRDTLDFIAAKSKPLGINESADKTVSFFVDDR